MNTMRETLARLRDRIRETEKSIKELDMVLILDSVYLSDKEEMRILNKIENLKDKLKEYKFIESNIINQYNNLVDLIYTSEMLIKYIDDKKC